MKKTLMILGIILLIIALPFNSMLTESFSAQNGPIKEVKEGDVIFQTSQSQQSPLIQLATRSSISHCGIIIMKNDEPYVLETLKTLTTTPLEEFIARGKGGKYWLKRSNLENIKIEYEHYLGKPYDLAFKFNNDKFYCSELIYDIYKEQLDIELCKPKKVSDYFILSIDKIPQMEQVMKKRGISKEQYVVAPIDIFESEFLKIITN